MNKIMKKDIVAGLGEIGLPILKLITKNENVVGYDLNKKLMDEKKFMKFECTRDFFSISPDTCVE